MIQEKEARINEEMPNLRKKNPIIEKEIIETVDIQLDMVKQYAGVKMLDYQNIQIKNDLQKKQFEGIERFFNIIGLYRLVIILCKNVIELSTRIWIILGRGVL